MAAELAVSLMGEAKPCQFQKGVFLKSLLENASMFGWFMQPKMLRLPSRHKKKSLLWQTFSPPDNAPPPRRRRVFKRIDAGKSLSVFLHEESNGLAGWGARSGSILRTKISVGF